jgi:hypothetical protein
MGDLGTLGEDMAVDCHNHEVSIGLKQNKEVNVHADLVDLLTKDTTCRAARTGKLNAVAAQGTADEAAIAFIIIARDLLKPHLGTSWSQIGWRRASPIIRWRFHLRSRVAWRCSWN